MTKKNVDKVNSRGCGRLYGGEWGVPTIEHDVSYGKIIIYDIYIYVHGEQGVPTKFEWGAPSCNAGIFFKNVGDRRGITKNIGRHFATKSNKTDMKWFLMVFVLSGTQLKATNLKHIYIYNYT